MVKGRARGTGCGVRGAAFEGVAGGLPVQDDGLASSTRSAARLGATGGRARSAAKKNGKLGGLRRGWREQVEKSGEIPACLHDRIPVWNLLALGPVEIPDFAGLAPLFQPLAQIAVNNGRELHRLLIDLRIEGLVSLV